MINSKEHTSLKRIKGVFLFFFFMGIAIILHTQREAGVASFLLRYQFAIEAWIAMFIGSALVNLVVAIRKAKWSIFGHSAWYMYTIATILAINDGIIPYIVGFIYTGVSILFILDTLNDEGVLDQWRVNR